MNKQFVVFIMVGTLNTIVGFILYAIFLAFGLHYTMAVLFSTLIGMVFNFFTTGRLVFHNTDKLRIIRFVLVYAVAYFINLGLIKFCLRLGFNEYMAYIMSLPLLALLSFFLMKQFVFTNATSMSYVVE